ncbi:lysylphosphatidylglycerol synthase transmembrane domain-containing protein [Fervidobacterium thailandense]|uniref:TIGR00374 family protein n=1 Tax=Fervidobacterium thailandense TaxID=1008305 RepID=A0A1E3G467_9BACT|nr:lysylphosphatidylglycerol synthase transmembrane domain-containing protein [Fervidobacterium thailandense]ODN31065.1 TIGR00374 family protein [Fervidobacterium thailandense]
MNLKKILLNILISVLIGFSIVTIIGIISAKQDLISALKLFPKYAILNLLVLLVIDYLLHALRLHFILIGLGYRVRFLDCLENVFYTVYFSFVTPMSIGGQPFQIYHLTRLGVKAYDATNVSISRMFIGVSIVFFVDILFIKRVLSILKGTVGLTVVLVGFGISVLITLLGLLVFLNKTWLYGVLRFVQKVTKSQKLRDRERAILEWIGKMSSSTKYLFSKAFWAVILDFLIGLVGSAIVAYQLKYALESVSHAQVPLFTFWGIVTMLNSVVYYVPTPGSSGGIEGFYQLVFSKLYGSKAAMSGILVFRLVTYYLVVFLGTIFIWRFTRIGRKFSGSLDEQVGNQLGAGKDDGSI